jgi:hypothetical protein
MNRHQWTKFELQLLRWTYPHVKTARLIDLLDHPLTAINGKAHQLGIRKTVEYLGSDAACRKIGHHPNSRATQFKKGLVPHNKGVKRPGWHSGRMSETWFKQGHRGGAAAKNWMPIGTIRVDGEGYLRIKVREGRAGEASGFGNTKIWPLYGRYLWEQHHGPIPPSHTVIFKDRNRANVVIDNLELISRKDLMARNTVHNLPKELALAIQLAGALKRQLRRRSEKRNNGSA